MSTEQQARSLMARHHHMIKNRKQSMLGRIATKIGMEIDPAQYWNSIQGKAHSNCCTLYDRSNVSMS
jgi:hypothetical protein